MATHRVTLSDLRDEILKSSHYQEMQAVLSSGYVSSPTVTTTPTITTTSIGYGVGMGIESGVLGGSALHYPTMPEYMPEYIPPTPYQSEPASEEQWIVVNGAALEKLNTDLAEAKRELAERDEMIEALVADMEDIEVLRAELDRLKSGAKVTLGEITSVEVISPGSGYVPPVTSDKDGWIEWHGDEYGHQPPDAIVEVKLRSCRDIGSRHAAKSLRWNHTGRGSRDADIIAYKIGG